MSERVQGREAIVRRFPGRMARVCTLAFSPDGNSLVSGGDGGLIRVWEAQLGRCRDRFRMGMDRVNCLAYSPDGSLIAAAHAYGGSYLWSVAEGRSLGRSSYYVNYTYSLDFRPDGGALVTSGGSPGHAILWAIPSREPMAQFAETDIACVAYHPDGSRIAVGSANPRIAIWDPTRFPKGAPISDERLFGGSGPPDGIRPDEVHRWTISHRTGCRCLRFSPDGRSLAASSGWSICLYDVEEGRRVVTMRGHGGMVKSLSFSPDGRTLASASHDGTIRLWDAETGERRACYDWGIGGVDSVAFSPDGMTIAAGGEGGIVVWDVEWA